MFLKMSKTIDKLYCVRQKNRDPAAKPARSPFQRTAPPRPKPQHGPGLGKSPPTWAEFGPLRRQPLAADPGRRIGSDGSPLISPGQNPAPAASPRKTLDHLPDSRFFLSCPAAPPAAPRRHAARSSRRAMAMPWLRASLVHLFLSPFPFFLPVRAGAAAPLRHSRWPPGHHGRRARTCPLLGAPL